MFRPTALLAAALLAAPLAAQAPSAAEQARLARILAATPLVDGHNDLPIQVRNRRNFSIDGLEAGTQPLMTDLDRLAAGGVGAQLWSVYISAGITGDEAVRTTIEQLDIVDRMVAAYPERLAWATSADDIEAIHASGRIASLAGIEGGHQIGGNLAALRQFRKLGAIYMTLTHGRTTGWADSATDAPRHGGLSDFGRVVVQEMNRIGMLVDLSHVTEDAMHDAIGTSRAPVIFSHSSARAIGSHPRNVPDSVLARLPEKDGIVMVTFVPSFLSDAVRNWGASRSGAEARYESLFTGDPEGLAAAMDKWDAANPAPTTSSSDVADHIDHVARIAGHQHVGIGGDLDGISSTPVDLDSADDYPALFFELMRRGWTDEELALLAGGNFLRVMRKAEAVAAAMDDVAPAIDPSPMAD